MKEERGVLGGGCPRSESRVCEGRKSQESLECSGEQRIHLTRGCVDWRSEEVSQNDQQSQADGTNHG